MKKILVLEDEANIRSFVTYGRGKAVITDTGMQTEVGKIAGLLKSTSEKQTPLQVNLEEFGKKLSILILIFCGILFAISVFRGEKIGSAFMFAVALAVAAIPEALSSIVTIVLLAHRRWQENMLSFASFRLWKVWEAFPSSALIKQEHLHRIK